MWRRFSIIMRHWPIGVNKFKHNVGINRLKVRAIRVPTGQPQSGFRIISFPCHQAAQHLLHPLLSHNTTPIKQSAWAKSQPNRIPSSMRLKWSLQRMGAIRTRKRWGRRIGGAGLLSNSRQSRADLSGIASCWWVGIGWKGLFLQNCPTRCFRLRRQLTIVRRRVSRCAGNPPVCSQ